MTGTLRILHLEDDVDYSDLVAAQLRESGIDCELSLVSTRAGFESALDNPNFDIILADYMLPDFDGLQALSMARALHPHTPFVMVSGTIGEQAAIESLRQGATDYVLKNWPERLIPVVSRAIRELEEYRYRCQAETELCRREEYFRALTENALDVFTILDENGLFVYNSPSIYRVLGYSPFEVRGICAFSLIHPEDLPAVTAAFTQGLQDPELTMTMEFRCRHRNGHWVYLEAIGRSHLNEPSIGGIVVNSREITDRKRVEEDLRQNEQQYRLLFDGNPLPMWVFDLDTLAFLEVNDAAVQHYGFSREEFQLMTLADLRPTEDDPALVEYLNGLLAEPSPEGAAFSGTWQHTRRDGSQIEVEMRWSPIHFQGRRAALAMANDITRRCRTEHQNAALSKLGQLLSTARTPAQAAEIIKGVADDLFRWDSFVLNLYASERDEIIPLHQVDTDREGNRYLLDLAGVNSGPSELARRIINEGPELILRHDPISPSPETTPIGDLARPSASLMFVPVTNGSCVIGILSIQSYSPQAYEEQDLAILQTLADHCGGALERIRAEEALRQSELRFRELFEASPDAIFVEDVNGTVLDVNPAACSLHQLTREEMLGMNVTGLVPEHLRETVMRSFPDLLQGRIKQIEGFSLTRTGDLIPVEICGNQIDYGGKPALLLHVRDITQRKQTEAALLSSEMLFHSVWANSVDGMRLTDEDGIIVAVNEAYCRLVDKPREELEGQPYTIVYSDSEEPVESMVRFRERFRERSVECHVEVTMTLHNGQVVTLEDTNSFVEQRNSPTLLLSLFRDVTQQRRLQEQLRQAQKMEAIGQLAGGVAHDFNNILTVIHGHASLMLSTGRLLPSPTRSAQQILQAAERASGLTRQLLAFGRRSIMQPRPVDLNELVCNLTNMLGRILGEDIALQLRYSPQPARIVADPSMVEQILMNFAVNSRDAMPSGGSLDISVSHTQINGEHTALHPEARAGTFICLTATDNGSGISPENLGRIFEPFFTTKKMGKGTGLGLATVYGIVKQHQGWIEVQSEPNRGSTFKVYLPADLDYRGATEPPNPLGAQVRGGKETILVVEDEAPVRELVCQLLAAQGYEILQAESGAKALEVWARCKDKVDLLLTDMVMPDRLNGRELAERLWAERPTLKVIFTSGYSAEVVGKDFVLDRGLNYLQKPYHPDRLTIAVRDCLDARN